MFNKIKNFMSSENGQLKLACIVLALCLVACVCIIEVQTFDSLQEAAAPATSVVRSAVIGVSHGTSTSSSLGITPISLGISGGHGESHGESYGYSRSVSVAPFGVGVSYGISSSEIVEDLEGFCKGLPSGYNFNVCFEGNGVVGWAAGVTGKDGTFDIAWNDAYESEEDTPYDVDLADDILEYYSEISGKMLKVIEIPIPIIEDGEDGEDIELDDPIAEEFVSPDGPAYNDEPEGIVSPDGPAYNDPESEPALNEGDIEPPSGYGEALEGDDLSTASDYSDDGLWTEPTL